MDENIPKGRVGVWFEGEKIMLRSVTEEGEAVPLSVAEAKNLATAIRTFAEQIEQGITK
jgi:hypothetical protein